MEQNIVKLPNGQVLIIDPAKFYLLELDNEKVLPHQVEAILKEFSAAGVEKGVVIGTTGGETLKLKEIEKP